VDPGTGCAHGTQKCHGLTHRAPFLFLSYTITNPTPDLSPNRSSHALLPPSLVVETIPRHRDFRDSNADFKVLKRVRNQPTSWQPVGLAKGGLPCRRVGAAEWEAKGGLSLWRRA
jgi:hypothetical protein